MIDKIVNYLKNLFNSNEDNIKNKNTCSTCVHWASEEMNNMPRIDNEFLNSGKRYCDIHKKYTKPNHICECYQEELFEATENSTQSEELSIDLSTELKLDKKSIE